jgi:hypothetical protein
MPFASVLGIDRTSKETIIIYDNSRGEEEIPFSKFKSRCSELELEKDYRVIRTKQISKSDFKQLKSIWD